MKNLFLSVFNDTAIIYHSHHWFITIIYSKKPEEEKHLYTSFRYLLHSSYNPIITNCSTISSLVIVLYNLWNILWHRVKVIVHLTPPDRQLNRYIRIYCSFINRKIKWLNICDHNWFRSLDLLKYTCLIRVYNN